MSARRLRLFTRRPATERQDEIRDCLRRGMSDPEEISRLLGVTKSLILTYANRMPDIDMVPYKRNGRGHLRIALYLRAQATVA